MFGYTSLGFGSGGVATAVTSVSAPSAPFFSDALGNGSVNATRGKWVDLFQHPYGPASTNHDHDFQSGQQVAITPPNAGPSPIEFVDFTLNFNVTSTATHTVQYSVVPINNGNGLVASVAFSAATSKSCIVRFVLDPNHQSNHAYEALIRVVCTNSGGSITYQEPVLFIVI
tara:strand:- start:273 stop:785 length:513 start_codon:yes stop_codon:yes gene_type:complete